MNKMNKYLIFLILTILFACASYAAYKYIYPPKIKPSIARISGKKLLGYQRIYSRDYQNFIKNWDDENYPVLYALIETSTQYDEIFHPAPVMGTNKPFSLDPEIYKQKELLLVARVTAPLSKAQEDKTFIIENIFINNSELSLLYRFNEPEPDSSLSKESLAILIPKGDYKKVSIFENGKKVGELLPNQGK